MQIDKYKLSINRFSTELPEPLDRDRKCLVTLEADICDVSTPDNEDGTHNQVFKAKHNGLILVKQGDAIIRGKDSKRMSQKLRGAIWNLQQDNGMMHKDEEKFYKQMMGIFITHGGELYDRYFKDV